MNDSNGNEIKVGDVLQSDNNFRVVVAKHSNGALYGKLICDSDNPCANLPYSLNEGRGYTVEKQ
jgi:hypothetical protein